MATSSRAQGFTIVELLVVMTIIVVLLAMLAPALDKAIYQAELASCAGKLRVIGAAVTDYANDHRGWYPYNRAHDTAVRENWLTRMLRHNNPSWAGDTDTRPALRPYIPKINDVFTDPMVPRPVELDQSNADLLYGSYNLWYGWAYTWSYPDGKLGKEDGMFKIGQKFSWGYDWDTGGRVERRFSSIAGDFDRVNGGYVASHPDKSNNSWFWAQVEEGGDALLEPRKTTTAAQWVTGGGREHGLIDMNAALQDLSVRRFNDVETRDDRFIRLPEYNNGSSSPASLMVQIPRE